MNSSLYLTYLIDQQKSLMIASDDEINSLILAQDSNKFIEENQKYVFERIGNAAEILTDLNFYKSKYDYNSLSITESADCTSFNMSHLGLLRLNVLSVNNKTFFTNDTLSILPNIEELIVHEKTDSEINLQLLPNLKIVRIIGFGNVEFKGHANAEIVTVNGLKKHKNILFEQLYPFNNAREIIINKTTSVDLLGIDGFKSLSRLEINYAIKLNSIVLVSKLPNLTEVKFEACRKINDFSPLLACAKLSKVVIANCGRISSIDFLIGLKNLKGVIILNTQVANGDYSVLEELKLSGCNVVRR
jgi:hypothetical protein